MPQGAKVARVPAGADKNVIANGVLTIHVHGGNKPGEGFGIFVENQMTPGHRALEVTLDFSKSTNLEILNHPRGMTVSVTVEAGEIVRAASLVAKDVGLRRVWDEVAERSEEVGGGRQPARAHRGLWARPG